MPVAIPKTPTLGKCAQLRTMLKSDELEFLLEAHNGLSARIVEESGFKGIWASGLAISAQFGVRDSNEASWTQVVDMLEFMSDVTTIPILLDGDTGYGNFNNLRRLVRKLEQRDIAGVCIEDKQFPKTNSFIGGERQPLCNIDEFCGKIKAGKDSQTNAEFCIVARVEALIAGWGLDEALRRAEAYYEAGADAILMHSKLSRADEILAFAKQWQNRAPLIIVPTKYYSTPTDVFRQAGISMAVWANHMVRASAAAMHSVATEIYASESVANVEDRVVSVDEIFRLQGAEELAEAERRYSHNPQQRANAIVLAATRGGDLGVMTEDRPKVMLPIGGKPLLQRLTETFKRQKIDDITVVSGYKPETINISGIRLAHNPCYQNSGELASLACASSAISQDTVITYGDLLFRRYILNDLLDSESEITVVVDSALPSGDSHCYRDIAVCSRPDDYSLFQEDVTLKCITLRHADIPGPPSGRWIGMLRVKGVGCDWLLESMGALQQREDFNCLGMPELLNHIVATPGRRIRVIYIHGHWLDINRIEDLARASDFAQVEHSHVKNKTKK